MSNISPQGYTYGLDPTSDNPFWSEEETEEAIDRVTFSASADQTTGDVKVDVTKNGYNVNFAFSGIKGEQGAQGIQGEKGDTGATGAQGEKGIDGISPEVVSTGLSESGAVAGTITGADGTVISVYNGAKGEKGEQGEQGETGPAGSTTGVVTDVSVTNENGVYTVSQTKDGASADVGQIEVPNTDNLLAEVTDSVVENTTTGYDFHTIKETENNGTQNDVGKFYIARKQITGLNSDGTFTTVDQDGNEGSGSISIPIAKDITIAEDNSFHSSYSNARLYTLTYKGNQSIGTEYNLLCHAGRWSNNYGMEDTNSNFLTVTYEYTDLEANETVEQTDSFYIDLNRPVSAKGIVDTHFESVYSSTSGLMMRSVKLRQETPSSTTGRRVFSVYVSIDTFYGNAIYISATPTISESTVS